MVALARPITERPPPPGPDRYVVQRHRASSDHYDLRLERHGTLVSWAVPKGPSLDPAVRRTAVRVDDHPREYFDFEGVIPAGTYGGGDVTVWDWGTYEVDGPGLTAGLRAGRVRVQMRGERLRGGFVLERTGRPGDRETWLIVHESDEHARAGWQPGAADRSVKSGRSPDEVRGTPWAVWHGDRPVDEARIALGATAEELATLARMPAAGAWHVGGHDIRLTNLDKRLFPSGTTKRDLLQYYALIAPVIIPHLGERAVNLHRYPDGVGSGKGFWQKDLPARTPAWVRRWRYVHGTSGVTHYPIVDRVATLAWLAQEAAVELHPWTSATDAPHRPLAAVVDIDPGEATTWDEVLVLARLFRTALEHLGVTGFPKVTGRRGVQISIPIARRYDFDATRAWVETLSRAVGATVPELVSWEWSKRARGGRARLDYTQNAINRTVVAPYSVRSSPSAAVATPIAWHELDDPDLRPDRWTITSLPDRLAEVGDLWAPMLQIEQDLPRID